MPKPDFRIAPIIKTIRSYDAGEWEIFVGEWMAARKIKYIEIKRYGGSGDKGRDVVGFYSKEKYSGAWDNCQCKHYETTIPLGKAMIDVAKILHHSFLKEYTPPVRSMFLGPKGPSLPLQRLLDDPAKLKEYIIINWEKS